MSDLVIGIFGAMSKAEEARQDLLKWQKELDAELDDALILEKREKRDAILHHMGHLTFRGALGGGFLGALLGVVLFNPVLSVLGLATGSLMGGVSGSLAHAGIDQEFMHEFAEHLQPGTAALALLLSRHPEKVLRELERFGGKVIHRHLKSEDHEHLRAVLESMETEIPC